MNNLLTAEPNVKPQRLFLLIRQLNYYVITCHTAMRQLHMPFRLAVNLRLLVSRLPRSTQYFLTQDTILGLGYFFGNGRATTWKTWDKTHKFLASGSGWRNLFRFVPRSCKIEGDMSSSSPGLTRILLGIQQPQLNIDTGNHRWIYYSKFRVLPWAKLSRKFAEWQRRDCRASTGQFPVADNDIQPSQRLPLTTKPQNISAYS